MEEEEKGFKWTQSKVKAEKILCFQQGKVDGSPKWNLIIISKTICSKLVILIQRLAFPLTSNKNQA